MISNIHSSEISSSWSILQSCHAQTKIFEASSCLIWAIKGVYFQTPPIFSSKAQLSITYIIYNHFLSTLGGKRCKAADCQRGWRSVSLCPTTPPDQLPTLHVQVYYSTFLDRDPSSKTFDSFPEIDSVDAPPICYFGQNTRLYPKPPQSRHKRIFQPSCSTEKPFASDPRPQSFRVN